MTFTNISNDCSERTHDERWQEVFWNVKQLLTKRNIFILEYKTANMTNGSAQCMMGKREPPLPLNTVLYLTVTIKLLTSLWNTLLESWQKHIFLKLCCENFQNGSRYLLNNRQIYETTQHSTFKHNKPNLLLFFTVDLRLIHLIWWMQLQCWNLNVTFSIWKKYGKMFLCGKNLLPK